MCSIGEDDFGDEGGIHAMIKDNDSKVPKNITGNCSKCGQEGKLFKLKFREPECSSCFLAYASHKFRATLGSSKILPRGSEVLLVFDGSAKSIVLLDMMHFAQKQNSFKRLHVETKILFIDETSLGYSNNSISDVKQFLKNYEFESFAISLKDENSLCNLQDVDSLDLNYKEPESQVKSIKTLTSRQDFLRILKYKLIEVAAKKLKCSYVFLPDISTNLATELINSIALGRGSSAALDVSLLDDRLSDVKLLRPLRNLCANEVKIYLEVKDLKPLKTESYGEATGPNASIQNLTRQFVNDLQTNFSSTISTVFRTGDKIAPKTASIHNPLDGYSKCTLCKSQLIDVPSKTLQALEFSRLASAYSGNMDNCKTKNKLNVDNFIDGLCHACANIQNDSEKVIVSISAENTTGSDIEEMSDLDEKEITFEEIGLSTNAIKLENIKKIVKLNLQIKRLPKQKDAFKADKNLLKNENNSNKPSTSKTSVVFKPVELPNKKSKPELIPKLCNGANCPATDQILSAIEELRDLVKKSCNETQDIRKDLLGIKDAVIDDNPSYVPFMRGPCQNLDDLNILEYRVQEDESSRKALEKLLGKIADSALERYVRCCLKAIISDKVAAQCTWHGKKDSVSVSVHDMAIIRVVCDCTRNKFPTASTSLVFKIMKKWFQYSKDRWRRSMEAKKLKFDAKEVLHHLT